MHPLRSKKPYALLRYLKYLFGALALVVTVNLLCLPLLLRYVQPQLLYRPHRSRQQDFAKAFATQAQGLLNDYSYQRIEVQGQVGHLLRYEASGQLPQQLWVVWGGSAMGGSDWVSLLALWGAAGRQLQGHFLVLDYPGYGQSSGKPSPGSIRAGAHALVTASLAQLPDCRGLSFFAHSLGTAAALDYARMLAEQAPEGLPALRKVVLSAPFTSVAALAMHMAPWMPAWLARLLCRHDWDSRANLAALLVRNTVVEVTIVHGPQDALVPLAMGKALAALDSARITLLTPDVTHNGLLDRHALCAHLLAAERCSSACACSQVPKQSP